MLISFRKQDSIFQNVGAEGEEEGEEEEDDEEEEEEEEAGLPDVLDLTYLLYLSAVYYLGVREI